MRFTIALSAACALSLTARAHDDPVMGSFTNDPVVLLTQNQERPGREDLAHRHGNFIYYFASEESRETFKADPARFEIQLGGACARMGALSSCADPDRYTVHEGRIYIFASDGCRAGFLKNPSAVLEPLADPAPTGTPEQMARGQELLDKCLNWMGGAARLDAVTTIEYREEMHVENRGEKHLSIETTTLRLPATIRTDYRWDSSSWTKTLTPEEAFFIESGGARSMHPQQRMIFARQMARQIPVIFAARARPDFVACHLGPARENNGELVAVHFDSTTTELIIEPDSGYLLGVRHLDWGPKGTLGAMERRFTTFAEIEGLRIPDGWQAWFEGERAEPLDKAFIGCVINADLPPDFFTREGKPVTPNSIRSGE